MLKRLLHLINIHVSLNSLNELPKTISGKIRRVEIRKNDEK